jgi:hypothetical protein
MKALDKKKTFNAYLGMPFGLSYHFYSFNFHAESYEDAARWVEQVFPGAEYRITDCDTIKKHKIVNGVLVEREVPPGKYRATDHHVLKELYGVYKKLSEDLERSRVAKTYWETNPNSGATEKTRQKYIETAKQNIDKAIAWSLRLLNEIDKLKKLGYE